MYKIEKIGLNTFFLKARGNFPTKAAQELKEVFLEKVEGLEYFSFIVDLSDVILISLDTLKMLLDLLKQNNEKLRKSAYIIRNNPPLGEEFMYVVNKAKNPKRKIVNSLEKAKAWMGITDIIIEKDE
jgi:anti-anti-sigma regulatory factor